MCLLCVLTKKTDIYCERTDFSFWSEPLNAITNVAFLVVAYFSWRMLKRLGPIPAQREAKFFIALLCIIAVGSFLFHTTAAKWAMIADVLPICVFILSYLSFTLMHMWHAPRIVVFSSIFLFLAVTVTVPFVTNVAALNGTMMYLPSMFVLFGMAVAGIAARIPHAPQLLYASFFFVISIGFRASDIIVCDLFPIGTHFMWHLSNAVVLAFMMRFFMLSSQATPPRRIIHETTPLSSGLTAVKQRA